MRVSAVKGLLMVTYERLPAAPGLHMYRQIKSSVVLVSSVQAPAREAGDVQWQRQR